MNRRDFLALIASAPIAALAPLPKVLEQPHILLRDPDGGVRHVPLGKRFWAQACECRGHNGHGASVTWGFPVKDRIPRCTACGTDWRAEYV